MEDIFKNGIIYNDDCLKKMSDIKDKSIDMILCDLPYGLTNNKEDIRIPFDKLWNQYERIIKDNGAIVLFAQGLFHVDLVNSNRKLFKYNYGNFKMTEDTRKGSTEKYPKSIIRFQKPHPSICKHRMEKSIDCLEWLIKTYTNEGEIILDNCMGSGTTCIACQNTNRKFIGIEINKKYYDISRDRIKENEQ